MIANDIIEVLRRKFTRLASELDERGRRRWAASEALSWVMGIKAVAQATGLGERTVRRGCQEVRHPPALARPARRRMRRAGGGRKALQNHDPALVSALEALVDPTTRGDPMSPLRWTCKSTRKLAKALTGQGHQSGHTTVAQLLADLDYSLQGTRKTLEGTAHPYCSSLSLSLSLSLRPPRLPGRRRPPPPPLPPPPVTARARGSRTPGSSGARCRNAVPVVEVLDRDSARSRPSRRSRSTPPSASVVVRCGVVRAAGREPGLGGGRQVGSRPPDRPRDGEARQRCVGLRRCPPRWR